MTMFARRNPSLTRRTLSGLLAAAAVLTATAEARAWCRTTTCKDGDPSCQKDPDTACPIDGSPLVWQHMPLTFRFYGRPAQLLREEARAAIRSAFYTWSDTLCGADQQRTSLRFVEGEDLTQDKPLIVGARGPEPFGIYFRDTGWPYTDNADSTLALGHRDQHRVHGYPEDHDEPGRGARRRSSGGHHPRGRSLHRSRALQGGQIDHGGELLWRQ
jgi:hypothetical protein